MSDEFDKLEYEPTEKLDYTDESKINRQQKKQSKASAKRNPDLVRSRVTRDPLQELLLREDINLKKAKKADEKRRAEEGNPLKGSKEKRSKVKRMMNLVEKRGINIFDLMDKVPGLKKFNQIGRWFVALEKAKKVMPKQLETLDKIAGKLPSLNQMTDKRIKREIQDYVAGKTKMTAGELKEIKNVYPDMKVPFEDIESTIKFAEKKGKAFKGKIPKVGDKQGTSPLTRRQKELTGLSDKDKDVIAAKRAEIDPKKYGAKVKGMQDDLPIFGKGQETFNLATGQGRASAFRELKGFKDKEIALQSLKGYAARLRRQIKSGKKDIVSRGNKKINLQIFMK